MRVKSLAHGVNSIIPSRGQNPQPCYHESNALTSEPLTQDTVITKSNIDMLQKQTKCVVGKINQDDVHGLDNVFILFYFISFDAKRNFPSPNPTSYETNSSLFVNDDCIKHVEKKISMSFIFNVSMESNNRSVVTEVLCSKRSCLSNRLS